MKKLLGRSIYYDIPGTGGRCQVVISQHPWKGRWHRLGVETVYHHYPLLEGASIAECALWGDRILNWHVGDGGQFSDGDVDVIASSIREQGGSPSYDARVNPRRKHPGESLEDFLWVLKEELAQEGRFLLAHGESGTPTAMGDMEVPPIKRYPEEKVVRIDRLPSRTFQEFREKLRKVLCWKLGLPVPSDGEFLFAVNEGDEEAVVTFEIRGQQYEVALCPGLPQFIERACWDGSLAPCLTGKVPAVVKMV